MVKITSPIKNSHSNLSGLKIEVTVTGGTEVGSADVGGDTISVSGAKGSKSGSGRISDGGGPLSAAISGLAASAGGGSASLPGPAATCVAEITGAG